MPPNDPLYHQHLPRERSMPNGFQLVQFRYLRPCPNDLTLGFLSSSTSSTYPLVVNDTNRHDLPTCLPCSADLYPPLVSQRSPSNSPAPAHVIYVSEQTYPDPSIVHCVGRCIVPTFGGSSFSQSSGSSSPSFPPRSIYCHVGPLGLGWPTVYDVNGSSFAKFSLERLTIPPSVLIPSLISPSVRAPYSLPP